MVSQNGRHSASPSLFPLLPATVEVSESLKAAQLTCFALSVMSSA